MFRGQYEHKMDSKGRVSLPARFRDVLAEMDPSGSSADRVILTKTFEDCLELYPMQRWLEFEQRVLELSGFDPHVQRLKRIYVACAVECSIDDHGRLLVPQQLRSFAGLERHVVWAGDLDTAQLWAKSKWDEAMEEALEDASNIHEHVAELGL